MGRGQEDTVFVFDEPTIGLHPLDVKTLLQVFQTLIEKGATVIVIEHDLDVMRRADYLIDMGPGGGEEGGQIVASGTPAEIAADPRSITGKYCGSGGRPIRSIRQKETVLLGRTVSELRLLYACGADNGNRTRLLSLGS